MWGGGGGGGGGGGKGRGGGERREEGEAKEGLSGVLTLLSREEWI